MPPESTTRCGLVALAGAPNAGKSKLLNALVGAVLAATSPKPQTTRVSVRGLLTEDNTQLILVDPAGLMEPSYPLQRATRHAALETIRDADVVLHLHPLSEYPAPALEELVEGRRSNVGGGSDASTFDSRPSTAFVVSALTGEGLHDLLAAIRATVPEGPVLYDGDAVSRQPLRFFAAEFVREASFAMLAQELPHWLAVEIEAFREHDDPVYIRATLAVERASQKLIVLGEGGRTIRAIGTAALERLGLPLPQETRP